MIILPPIPSKETRQTESFYCYLPIPDDVFHSGIYVKSVGAGPINPGEPYPPVRHPALYHFDWNQGRMLPEFSLMLVTGGDMFKSKITRQVPIKANTAILLFPDTWHRYAPAAESGWTEAWVHFNGELAHRLLEQGVITPERPVIPLTDARPAIRAFARLLNHVHALPDHQLAARFLDGRQRAHGRHRPREPINNRLKIA